MDTHTDLIKGDYICANGPWSGSRMYLTKQTGIYAATGYFTFNGEHGRYVEDPIDGKLYWEKADAFRTN